MATELPEITHLQFLVLDCLRQVERPGRAVRQRLHEHGVRRTGPAFYQLMARLEDADLLEGRYDQKIVEGQIIKERRYKVTTAGLEAWRRTRDFYLDSIRGAELRERLEGV